METFSAFENEKVGYLGKLTTKYAKETNNFQWENPFIQQRIPQNELLKPNNWEQPKIKIEPKIESESNTESKIDPQPEKIQEETFTEPEHKVKPGSKNKLYTIILCVLMTLILLIYILPN